jgi:RimJ/RimL family protein N-acetyltransferase
MTTFRTRRLTVSPWRDTDLDDLAGVVRRIVGVGDDLPPEWREIGGEEWLDARDAEGRVFLATARRPVGLLITDLPRTPPLGPVHVGYVIAPDAAGNGFATELLVGFTSWASGQGVSRLVAGVDPSNEASVRVLEKAGFRPADRPFYELELDPA